ncbi:sigma-70 family RNA polymerase sigma factor [uncultured Roseibium sp.]|uniref:sigma-70 family RNA polymerase sigma factor n=1 Tax=uncultured Roseibium sp. TaxID=1936171 RepID=UPI0032176146
MKPDRSHLVAEIPHLRRYARALTRNSERADDLVQGCLERALRGFHSIRQGKRLRPWLFAILRNLHVDMIRHQSARGLPLPLDENDMTASKGPGPDGRLEVKAVLDEIDRLPQEQRDAVLLIGIEELNYAEAAEVLGIPIGTLMSRLHRGRTRLRESLGRTEGKPAIRRVK